MIAYRSVMMAEFDYIIIINNAMTGLKDPKYQVSERDKNS